MYVNCRRKENKSISRVLTYKVYKKQAITKLFITVHMYVCIYVSYVYTIVVNNNNNFLNKIFTNEVNHRFN